MFYSRRYDAAELQQWFEARVYELLAE